MIRGQKRALDKQTSVNVNLNASIHNRFDFEVIDSKTGKIKKKAVGYNTICDGFWEELDKRPVYFLAFGGGAGTPSPSDRALFQLIGTAELSSATIVNNTNQEENWYSYQIKITLSETEYVGQTFTEVGCMTSKSVLTTHAMLQDMNGNPVSIKKTNTDIINIYCTLFIHWSDSYANGAIIPTFGNFSNSSFLTNFFITNGLPYWDMYLLKGSILTARSKDNGFIYNAKLGISYDKAKKIATYTARRIPVGEGNASGGTLAIGIGWPVNDYYHRFDLFLDCGKLLPHSIITGESVATGDGSTSDFCTKFSPAYDIEVYVDGVLSTDVTVDENVPTNFSNIMGTCFIPVPHASDQLPPEGSPSFPSLNNSVNQNNLYRLVAYNPYWEKGISTIVPQNPNTYNLKIEVSDNLLTWTTLWDGISPSPNLAIPAEYQNSKYFAFSGSNIDNIIARDIQPTNIHFASPPASGAVITANYKAKCIAKDTFHVFDFSMSIQFGEYTK